MSITDELREWANVEVPYKYGHQLTAIADRIDAEHEDVVRKKAARMLTKTSEYMNDDDLAEIGLVRLPKDADGEVINVGDVMERGLARGRVIALMLSNYPKKWGGKLHWAIQLEGEHAPTALDNFFHHYRPPTLEDVMRDFATDWEYAADGEDKEAVLKEYAKRLTLRAEVDS